VIRPRASDRLTDPAWVSDPEFSAWCSLAILLWNIDPALRVEFLDIVDFFDWSYEIASRLLLSAEN
jgi:hypothetical protein